MFYIARNTLAVTGPMTKKAALSLWADIKAMGQVNANDRIQLCREDGKLNPTVVMELN